MADEPEDLRTFKEKALFYTTAFFVLLGTFSLFAFLFLVPFVIDPAFTTIFMQFDIEPAFCVTVEIEHFKGASNCSWTSCREGCTKEVYECTQIRVNYKTAKSDNKTDELLLTAATATTIGGDNNNNNGGTTTSNKNNFSKNRNSRSSNSINNNNINNNIGSDGPNKEPISMAALDSSSSISSGSSSSRNSHSSSSSSSGNNSNKVDENENEQDELHHNQQHHQHSSPSSSSSSSTIARFERALREYDDYISSDTNSFENSNLAASPDLTGNGLEFLDYSDLSLESGGSGLMGNNSEWYFTGARLFPNVKGCGYPPMLNCSIWSKKFIQIGSNFSCYYSKVDPGLVISDLDMWQNTLNLVYAMAIPIPSFIISVIYLTFAYFKIYNEDEESAPLDKNAEDMADEDLQQQQQKSITDGDEEGNIDENDETNCNGIQIHEPNADDSGSGGGGIGGGGGSRGSRGSRCSRRSNGSTGGGSGTGGVGGGAGDGTTSVPLTPNSADMESFGHQLKVKMADEMSRESLDGGFMSNSGSLQGNLSKTMTTSISTPPGPIAIV